MPSRDRTPTCPSGIFVDNIVLTAGGEVLLEDGAETGGEGWTFDGFTIVGAEQSTFYDNYYIASNREYIAYDRYLQTGPYNFGFLDSRPDWVEHFPYQDGLLIWYWDTSFSDNDVGNHPGQGEILPIDAHPRPIARLDGQFWRGRIALYDATFGLQQADSFTLHVNSQPSYIRGQDAVAGVRRPAVVLGRAHSDHRREGAQCGRAHPRARGARDVGADPDHVDGGRWISPSLASGLRGISSQPVRLFRNRPWAQSRRTTVTSTRRQAMARSGVGLLAVLLLALGAGCGSDSSDTDATSSEAGSSDTPTPETTTRPPLSSIPPPTMTSPPKRRRPRRTRSNR